MNSSEGDRQAEILTLPEYEKMVTHIRETCEAWVMGTCGSETLTAEFDRVREKHWGIEGFYGLPDDYDWSQKPQSLCDQVEKARQTFSTAFCILSTTIEANEFIRQRDEVNDSCLARAIILGTLVSEKLDKLDLEL